MVKWVEGHMGTFAASVVAILVVGGVVASIIGWAAGDDVVAENGWVVSVLAGMVGMTMRGGYQIGKHAQFERLTDELHRLNDNVERQGEELEAARGAIVDMYEKLSGADRGGSVHQFPKQNR